MAAAASSGDCSACTRRTFLKGVGATAAGTVAATGGLTAVATGQQSGGDSSVEVIDGGYEVEVTDLPNNTLENKIIRARGEVVNITARGDEFTIRNVGIQGPVAKGGNAGLSNRSLPPRAGRESFRTAISMTLATIACSSTLRMLAGSISRRRTSEKASKIRFTVLLLAMDRNSPSVEKTLAREGQFTSTNAILKERSIMHSA